MTYKVLKSACLHIQKEFFYNFSIFKKLDTNLKIILLDHENNRNLKHNDQYYKKFGHFSN